MWLPKILFSYILVDQLRLFSFISKTFEDFEFLEIFSYKVFLYGIIFLFGFFIFYGGSLIHEIKKIKISSSRDKFSKAESKNNRAAPAQKLLPFPRITNALRS